MLLRKENEVDFSDITVLNSVITYDKDRNMDTVLYEMEAKDENGRKILLYKAIKMLKIVRLPKSVKEETNFMKKHSEVLAGLWERQVNLVTVISNILYPEPLGLMFVYGVQGVASTVEEAIELANSDYTALRLSIQGSYRTMEYRELTADEAEWLRNKIGSMKYLSMLRGVPAAKNSPGEGGSTFGGRNKNPDTLETTEEIVAGLSDREYVIMMISTPVSSSVLEKWLTQTSKANTKWQSQMQGTTGLNFGLNIPMMFMGNLGASQGWSEGTSSGESYGESLSESSSTSFGESWGVNSSVSNSVSEGWSEGFSSGVSTSQGVGTSEGISTSDSIGTSESVGTSSSFGTSESSGFSKNWGESEGLSGSKSESVSQSISKGTSEGASFGQSVSQGTSFSEGISEGRSASNSSSQSQSTSTSQSKSFSNSSGMNVGSSSGESTGTNVGAGGSAGVISSNTSDSYSRNLSDSVGYSTSSGSSTSGSKGFSQGVGTSQSVGTSSGYSQSQGRSESIGYSAGVSYGKSESVSHGTGSSVSEGWSSGKSVSEGVSSSKGVSYSDGVSSSKGVSMSKGMGTSQGVSTSQGVGTSQGYSVGRSGSVSQSVSQGESYGQSTSQSQSQGSGVSWGASRGTSQGFSQALSSGTSASMGIGASLGISKSYQFIDVEVRNIVMIYEQQTERLMKALQGQGAFFTDLYVATPDKETSAAATSLSKSAWQNEQALFCPLQVVDLEGDELQHMLYHFAAFSSCRTREGVKGGIQSYKYSTILLADELTAYTHPVRLSEGGQFADIENIPILSIPAQLKGEIYIGKILSGERWVKGDGYRTKFDYRVDGGSNMHHMFFTGESRSGKTVMATRFIVETALKTKRNGKRMRIIVMDPKQDWRVLSKFIETDRFRFYSLGDPELLPIKMNLLRVPKNVRPQVYADGIIENFQRAYQLGEKVKPILRDAIYKAYDDAGVFCEAWRERAHDLSKDVSFSAIFRRIKTKMEELKANRATPSILEAYERLLDRLDMFSKPYTVEYQMFGQGGPDAMSIDQILGEDDVIVLESYGLDNTFKSFVFGTITTAIWFYCYSHEGGFKSDGQYSTLLVIEEANEVLIGQSAGDSSPVQGTSLFEKIVDQAAGLELFICSITQKIADMPQSIIANSGLAFSGKISREEDKDVFMNKIGKDPKIDDKPLLKFLPKMPTGWFICKSGRTFDYKEAESVLVAVDRLDVNPPTNSELLKLMEKKIIDTHIREIEQK